MTESAVLEAAPVTPPVNLDHLSWTAIKTYQACPRKFWFKYIERVPEEFRASTLAFGSAFHTAVERVQEARLQGLDVPAVDELLAIYEQAWTRETQGRLIRYCKDEDEASLHDLALRMLDAYVAYAELELTLPDQAQVISIEHANRFRLLAEVPEIESHIDLLELSGTNLIVSDLKNSRCRWNDVKLQEAIPQLVLYALGLLPLMRELGATRIITKFVVVTKGKKPKVQVLQPQATQEDVVHLKRTITETWSGIQGGQFPKQKSWACSLCPFMGQCLGGEFRTAPVQSSPDLAMPGDDRDEACEI